MSKTNRKFTFTSPEDAGAQLLQLMKDDPEYLAAVEAAALERRAIDESPAHRAAEAARRERQAELRRAEGPVLEDLHALGVNASGLWEIDPRDPLPAEALGVLLGYLERGQLPDQTLEYLARALGRKESVHLWPRLHACYQLARGESEKDGLAIALADSATSDQLEQLISLVHDESRGESRIFLLEPIMRYGGDRGRAVVKALKRDPAVGAEARALLRRRAGGGRT